MVIQEKVDKAMEYHHKKQMKKAEKYCDQYGGDRLEVEKGDVAAMMLSAFLMLVPVVLVILLIVVGAGYFFLLH